MEITESRTITARVLDWLRAGYPEGIPKQDYEPLLGLLRRKLTTQDVRAIAADLVAQSQQTEEPVTEEDIRAMIEETVVQSASGDDIARVSAHLAAGGWPLESELDD